MWDDAKMCSKIMKTNCRDVKAIYDDLSLRWLNQAKQSADKSCLSTTSTTNDPYFVPAFDDAPYSPKNKWRIVLISDLFDVNI